MASTLKINTLTGVSTAGSIAVTGEGNSTTTNLQQGLAKCWAHFNGGSIDSTADLTGVQDSFNASSVVDDGTGDHDVNYTSVMSNDDYSFSVNGGGGSTFAVGNIADDGLFTTHINVKFRRLDNNNALDSQESGMSVLGDLA